MTHMFWFGGGRFQRPFSVQAGETIVSQGEVAEISGRKGGWASDTRVELVSDTRSDLT